MQLISSGFVPNNRKLYTWASTLALITIFYNIVEGAVSVFFGLEDESFALFGFGLDSFVEVISGIGIWHMVRRIRRTAAERSDPGTVTIQRALPQEETGEKLNRFECTALRITGTGFYILAVGLSVTAVVNVIQGHKPETTFWGVLISLISIFTMWLLIHYKTTVGRQLNSPAILADAACTRACLQLSVVLLVASAGYELTGIGGWDAAGTLVIAVLCFREGKEAIEKASANSLACTCGGTCEKGGA